MANPVTRRLFKFAENMRFPQLFMLTAGIFVLDLLIPDVIPFVDEIVLGLGTLVLGSWRRGKQTRDPKRK